MKVKTLRRCVVILSVILVILLGVSLWLALWANNRPSNNEKPLFGWQNLNGETYYFDPETGIKCTGWLTLPDGVYFLNEDGTPVIGLHSCPQGNYYFDDQGRMVIGWADTADGKRYFSEDGTMVVGFFDLDGNRYCFDQGGILCTGWQYLQDRYYYFDESGIMITTPGWLHLEEGTWYLKEDGQPYTGWMQTNEARYYFLEDGTMAVGSCYIDDTFHYFSPDGNYVPLVNPWNKVPDDYQANLVEIEGHRVDSTCVTALKEMISAARQAGLTCELNSSYRDMANQTYLWNRRYNEYLSQGNSAEEAYRLTARRVAYPGTSEHHTGLAVDIVELIKDGTLYQWFREHAWEYGFTVRYRGEKEALTGIKDEPWHLRYVGTDIAQILQEKDWCLEEFMNQFTQ